MRFAVFAALVTAGLPVAAQAAPTVELLSLQNGMSCNEQGDWCLAVDADGPYATSRTLRNTYHLWDGPEVSSHQDLSIWPNLIRLSEDRALAGVILNEDHPFSGGGMTVQTLHLFDVTLGDTAMSNGIATIPLSSTADIRACFEEADLDKRLGACHDEYAFKSDLTIIVTDADHPELHVQTQATRYPLGASRDRDSDLEPPLTPEMLVKTIDATCSYQATYVFDAANSIYATTEPLPDCSEFLQL